MNLIKTSVLNGIGVVIKLASAILLNKVLSIYVGPGGYAIIGQFQNGLSIIGNLVGGLFASGVIKSTAQHFDNEVKQHAIWQTSIRVTLITTIAACLGLILMRNWLSIILLNSNEMSSIFIWLAISLPAMAANNILLSIANGKKEIGIYVAANIVGSLLSLIIAGTLTSFFGLYGALLAFTITPALVLITTAKMLSQRKWFSVISLWGEVNRNALKELAGPCLMGATTALAVPLSNIAIRECLIITLGINYAGYWQAISKISELYLILVTSTLAVYYLPRLAEIKNKKELKDEVIKVYKFCMPIVMMGAFFIYLIRQFIFDTLFTREFSPAIELFQWQLTGDVIKIGAWILSYIMLGKAMVKEFIITEIAFSSLAVILTIVLVNELGFIGVSIAYTINYLLYWVVIALLINYKVNHKMDDVLLPRT